MYILSMHHCSSFKQQYFGDNYDDFVLSCAGSSWSFNEARGPPCLHRQTRRSQIPGRLIDTPFSYFCTQYKKFFFFPIHNLLLIFDYMCIRKRSFAGKMFCSTVWGWLFSFNHAVPIQVFLTQDRSLFMFIFPRLYAFEQSNLAFENHLFLSNYGFVSCFYFKIWSHWASSVRALVFYFTFCGSPKLFGIRSF